MRAALAACLLLLTSPAVGSQTRTFALVVGVNESIDRHLGRLRYADDDAARYHDLFRALDVQVTLLSRLDDNTRRLHPRAAAVARLPRQAVLTQAVRELRLQIARARQGGQRTLLYVVYAGHGNVASGRGYLTLEDARLDAQALRQLVRQLDAHQAHLIVDACHSYFLAHARGPGGARRTLSGFSSHAFAGDNVGLLLSTTASRESHEWEAFQAGVFSHEVRSGLYGAADADGDGRVSYREIAAFVERANAAIPNERFRPRVFARAPRATVDLLDLRRARSRRVQIDGNRHGHYLLEDTRGVRLADVHGGAGHSAYLVRPKDAGLLYLRRLTSQQEYQLPSGPALLRLALLRPTPPTAHARGAAHHAFSLVFSLPFSQQVAQTYVAPPEEPLPGGPRHRDTPPPRRSRLRRPLFWTALGLGLGSAAAAVTLTLRSNALSREPTAGVSHNELAARDASISRQNIASIVLYGVTGALVVTSLVAVLWPERGKARRPTLALTPGGAQVVGRF